MPNKILKTRIQLKYDSYTNWQTNNPVLNAGEIGIAYLTTAGAVAPGSTDTQHPVLFKVGNGTAQFNSLPWASALAADVHTWAKKSEQEFLEYLSNESGITIGGKTYKFVTQSELDAIVTELTDLIDEVDAKFDDYVTTSEFSAFRETNDAAIADAKKAGTDASGALEAYKQEVESELDTLVSDTLPNTYATPGDLSALKQTIIGNTNHTSSAPSLYGVKKYADEKIAALVNGAPETLNTLDELAAALEDNADIVDVLRDSIGNKLDTDEFTTWKTETFDPVAGKAHEHTNKGVLDSITTDAVESWNTASSKAHQHTNSAELDKIAAGDVEKWNNAAAQGDLDEVAGDVQEIQENYVKVTEFKDSANNTRYQMQVNEDVIIFDCGDASSNW